MTVSVFVADIEWIDRRGPALVCGRLVSPNDIRDLEHRGDRRDDGHLTTDAKQRIAAALAHRLEARPYAHVRECRG